MGTFYEGQMQDVLAHPESIRYVFDAAIDYEA